MNEKRGMPTFLALYTVIRLSGFRHKEENRLKQNRKVFHKYKTVSQHLDGQNQANSYREYE